MTSKADLAISLPLPPHYAAWLLVRVLGGAGSGHHGHAGRPGKKGGSVGSSTGGLTQDDVQTGKPLTATFYRGTATGAAESVYGWLTTDRIEAIRYADAAASRSNSDPIIVTYPVSLKNPLVTFKGTEILNAGSGTLSRLDNISHDALVYWHTGGIAIKSNPHPTPRVWMFARLGSLKGLGGAGSGHHGHAGRPGKKGGSAPGLSGLAIAPIEQSPEGGFLLSTRLPTSKRIYKPATELLVTDLDLVLRDPDAVKAAAEMFAKTDLLTAEERKLPPKERVLAAVASMKENLRLLYNDYDPALAERASHWYFGAHRMTKEMAAQHGMEPHQVAGVIASLSPQMDWFQNVSLAERVITITKKFDKENPVFSKKIFDKFAEKWEPATESKSRRAKPDTYKGTDAEWAVHQKQLTGIRDQQMQAIQGHVGSRWKDLPPSAQAFMLRTWDELHNPRSYGVVNPEGDRLGLMRTGTGKPRDIGWGASNFIENAMSITRNGSAENISATLGGRPKVRSFYNNMVDPWDERSVTIDTHAVAAAFLRPLARSSPEVTFSMGSGKGNLPANNVTGLKGTNPIIAQAYFDLAKELGVKPDRLQSIVWEAGRGLFRPEQKRSVEGRALALKTEELWNSYKKGKITRGDLYGQLKKAAGGIEPPAWAGSPISEQGRVVDRSVSSGRRAVPSRRRSAGRYPGEFAWVDPGAERGGVLYGADGSLNTLGGPGSGHHGHAGRPGKVGGSAVDWSKPTISYTKGDDPIFDASENLRLRFRNDLGISGFVAPHPITLQAAEVALDTIKEMKDRGYAMPRSVFINRDKEMYGEVSDRAELRLFLPETLPASANLDDAVKVAFGGKTPKGFDLFAPQSFREIVIHEMAHVQDMGSPHINPRSIPSDFWVAVNKLHPGTNPEGIEQRIEQAFRTVSDYAVKNRQEFVAEGFTKKYRREALTEDADILYKLYEGPVIR